MKNRPNLMPALPRKPAAKGLGFIPKGKGFFATELLSRRRELPLAEMELLSSQMEWLLW